jgi:hypothetical protein
VNARPRLENKMPDTHKKSAKTFEHKSEPMPRLVDEASAGELALETTEKSEVRTVRVPKLDQKTVWRVIDMLKSL